MCCTLLCAIIEEMKSNITLKLEDELLRKARILAAEEDTSISALLARQLEKAVREREGYEQAKRQALAAIKKGLELGFAPPGSRDELHER
jgi:predicted transcriptional regulator